jgi:hypothetical protein
VIFKFKQRGMASVEFALIAVLLIVMLLGILVYWRVFQAQQSLTRAAGDGARAVLGLVDTNNPCISSPALAAAHRENIRSGLEQTVRRTLEHSSMPGLVSQQLTIGALDWSAACPSSGSTSTVIFHLSYQLPSLLGTPNPIIGELDRLSEKSVVHFSSLL